MINFWAAYRLRCLRLLAVPPQRDVVLAQHTTRRKVRPYEKTHSPHLERVNKRHASFSFGDRFDRTPERAVLIGYGDVQQYLGHRVASEQLRQAHVNKLCCG